MGVGASQEPEPAAAELALFLPHELSALRAAYRSIASPQGLHAAQLEVLGDAVPWDALFRLMASLEEPPVPADGGVVTFRGFLFAVARCCKVGRRERAETILALYGGAELSEAQLGRAMHDALVAVRAGAPAEAATDESLSAALADARLGLPDGAGLRAEAWLDWTSAQLPALSLVLELHILEHLCAVGRAAEAAAKRGGAAASSGGGAPRLELGAALEAVQEPLLVPAEGQEEGHELLTPTHGWLLALALGPAAAGEAREWRCLYASRSHGLSMNRFAHHAAGYSGPTLLLVLTEADELFGAALDAPLKPSDKFSSAGNGGFLFTLAPRFHVYRPTAIAKNYVLYNPPQQGALRTEVYLHGGSDAPPELVGFGGQTARLRMSLEDDLNQLRWHRSCTTYAMHPRDDGAPPEGVRRVRAVELWGCGGADADKVQRELRERRVRDGARAGKVDRAAMFGMGGGSDWRDENNPDRLILESAGAHTFYSATLEKLPAEKPGGAAGSKE